MMPTLIGDAMERTVEMVLHKTNGDSASLESLRSLAVRWAIATIYATIMSVVGVVGFNSPGIGFEMNPPPGFRSCHAYDIFCEKAWDDCNAAIRNAPKSARRPSMPI